VLLAAADTDLNLPKAGLALKSVRPYAGNCDERRICLDEWSQMTDEWFCFFILYCGWILKLKISGMTARNEGRRVAKTTLSTT
jgi:hypothetical protein